MREANEEEVNGEQVRQAVEKMEAQESVRAVFSGLSFVMAVVGLWGDGA